MPRKRLEGRSLRARGWRKIPAAPGLSGKAARPVTGRTRDTGSGWQAHPPAPRGGRGRKAEPVRATAETGRKNRAARPVRKASAGDIPPVITVIIAEAGRIRHAGYLINRRLQVAPVKSVIRIMAVLRPLHRCIDVAVCERAVQ